MLRSEWLRHPAFVPVTLALSASLLLASLALWVNSTRAPATISATSRSTATSANTIVDYIVGAVQRPGVYTLAASDRTQQLLDAAGGPATNADLARVNLAARLFDGEEVYVPRVGEDFPAGSVNGITVNINSADAATMQTQLGITAKEAAAIVAYRTQHGPFIAVAQLLLVPISQTVYNRIKDQVSV